MKSQTLKKAFNLQVTVLILEEAQFVFHAKLLS